MRLLSLFPDENFTKFIASSFVLDNKHAHCVNSEVEIVLQSFHQNWELGLMNLMT